MEQKLQQNELTKEGKEEGVYLTQAEAEEYRVYRRRQTVNSITAAIASSVATVLEKEDVQRACERAVRLKQAAVKTPLSKLGQTVYYLSGSAVKADCVIGGTGETLSKVKAYEAKLARRHGAQEITLVVTPSFVEYGRYGEVERELKRVKRAVGKLPLKVRVDNVGATGALTRVARIACVAGARCFSVPYFTGCEKLRQDMSGGCQLEVSGVETLGDYQHLRAAGVLKIVTSHAWEIYTEWVRVTNLEEDRQAEQKKTEQKPAPRQEEKAKDDDKDYYCVLEGDKLKFL